MLRISRSWSYLPQIHIFQISKRSFLTSTVASSAKPDTCSVSPVRALIIGSPGSGKGTLSKRLLNAIPALHYLSAGDILRDERKRGTELGQEADMVMRKGTLMPDSTMMSMIDRRVEALDLSSNPSSWLLDGFPRTRQQAIMFDTALYERGQALNLILHLDVPKDVLINRILDRWIHEPSGRTYNASFNPPKVAGKDDETGEPLVKRVDDDAEIFAARLQSYESLTAPMVEYFQQLDQKPKDVLDQGNTYVRLQGATSDEIWPQMLDVVRRRFGNIVKL